jgi:hypothetical protein
VLDTSPIAVSFTSTGGDWPTRLAASSSLLVICQIVVVPVRRTPLTFTLNFCSESVAFTTASVRNLWSALSAATISIWICRAACAGSRQVAYDVLHGTGLWGIAGERNRDGAGAQLLAVKLEEQAIGVEGCAGLVIVQFGDAHGERRHAKKVGFAEHFVEDHGIGESQFQIGLSAGIGIFVIRHEYVFGPHLRIALLVLPRLFAFQLYAIRRDPKDRSRFGWHIGSFSHAEGRSYAMWVFEESPFRSGQGQMNFALALPRLILREQWKVTSFGCPHHPLPSTTPLS